MQFGEIPMSLRLSLVRRLYAVHEFPEGLKSRHLHLSSEV